MQTTFSQDTTPGDAMIIQFPRPAPDPTEKEFLAQDRAFAARIDAVTALWAARAAAEAASRPSATVLQFRPRQDQDVCMKPGPCPCVLPCPLVGGR